MDDLKVYAESSNALGDTLRVVDRVLRAVRMELDLRKCVVAHIKWGKYVYGEGLPVAGGATDQTCSAGRY